MRTEKQIRVFAAKLMGAERGAKKMGNIHAAAAARAMADALLWAAGDDDDDQEGICGMEADLRRVDEVMDARRKAANN